MDELKIPGVRPPETAKLQASSFGRWPRRSSGSLSSGNDWMTRHTAFQDRVSGPALTYAVCTRKECDHHAELLVVETAR